MYWTPDHEEWRQISEPLWSYHFLEDRERAYGSETWGDVALFVKEGILELVLEPEPEPQAQAQAPLPVFYAAALFRIRVGSLSKLNIPYEFKELKHLY